MKPSVTLTIPDFDLDSSLFCGQCFRWRKLDNGGYSGIIGRSPVTVVKNGDVLSVCGAANAEEVKSYFAADQNYAEIKSVICRDETIMRAVSYAGGIRVLRQPLFETLCSFIISQNNNIPRITGIIERLCDSFGEPTESRSLFPLPETLASLTAEDLAPIRSGFRAKYLIDAAQKYVSGEIDVSVVADAPLDRARAELMKIKGVGPKVADCVLLFGAGRYDAFPRDVWINRAMAELFPDGLPDFVLPFAGIAQQYIFHYARTSGIFNR